MSRRWCLGVLCVVMWTSAIYAQTANDVLKTFRDSVANKQLVLRNFSGEEKVRGRWNGSALEVDEPRWRTLGVLTVDAVKLKDGMLTLSCTRRILIRDKSDEMKLYDDAMPVEVEIQMGDSAAAEALPELNGDLFYPTIHDAIAALPSGVKERLPARIDRGPIKAHEASKPNPLCDCAMKDSADCAISSAMSEGMRPPKYLGGEAPDFTDRARKAKRHGLVDVSLQVDENGHPVDLWIIRPLGMGLDESAAESVLTYKFRPAMCHGEPIRVYLNVEVRFDIH